MNQRVGLMLLLVVQACAAAGGPLLPGRSAALSSNVPLSSYFGGSGFDAITGVARDASGNIYLTGWTESANLPVKSAVQSRFGGVVDAFVAKFDPSLTNLFYCTYLGGANDDRSFGIAVDTTGSAYVTGWTYSSDFPTAGAPVQAQLAGGRDLFVAKLNPTGDHLVYSTYLGGSGSEAGRGIAVDSAGNAYVTGETTSSRFPTLNPLQSNLAGPQNAFITALDVSGKLRFSTYLGGSGTDGASAIAVDSFGSAYVTGSTTSPNFPVANAFQTKPGGAQDAFVAKLASNGGSLVYSSYFGGSGGVVGYPEAGMGIDVDSGGNAFFAGMTSSSDLPVLDAFQPKLAGSLNAFVAKLNGVGNLLFSTYLGGSNTDYGTALRLNGAGNVCISGYGNSGDFPALHSVQPGNAGSYDTFLSCLTTSGSSLTFSSLLGGSDSDAANALVVDAASAYLVGQTLSQNFPTAAPFQSFNAGGQDGFFARILPWSAPSVVSATPASGSGAAQTFGVTVTHPNGPAAIGNIAFLLNTGLSGVNGCWVFFNPPSNTLQLANDAATGLSSPIAIGANASLSNSQCTVSAVSASVAVSGNNLTVYFPLSFSGLFAGLKTSFAITVDTGGQNSGWLNTGSWTVPSLAPPAPLSLIPATGSGAAQTFAITVTDPAGPSAIAYVGLLMNTGISGPNACWVIYSRAANTLQLANDAATGLSAPVALGATSWLSNSQCTVIASTASTTISGNNLTLNVSLTFTAAFAGAKTSFVVASDNTQSSGWQAEGSWNVTPPSPPTVVSTAPASGSGTAQTFAVTVSDPNGAAAITLVTLLLNNGLNGANGCWVLFNRAGNTLQLANDAATGFSASVTMGTAATLSNSQCTMSAAAVTAAVNGNNLTVSIPISFAFGFAGVKASFGLVYDSNLNSGWRNTGSWTVPASGPPAIVSATPASGTGSSQTFAVTVADGGGPAAIGVISFLLSNGLNGANACWPIYNKAVNSLQLVNDAGTGLLGPITVGSGTTLSNGQCTIYAATASASSAGSTLTVNVPVSFTGTFAGTKSAFALVYDTGNLNSGWNSTGTWIVPAM